MSSKVMIACAATMVVVGALQPARPSLSRPSLRPQYSEPNKGSFSSTDGGAISGGGFNAKGEPPIEVRGFSLAKSFLAAGTLITGASFVEFFVNAGGEGLSSLGFIYGIPILLIGCSLQYAELEPAGFQYDGDEEQLETIFDKYATETMLKIRKDVTRHRYGDEAHLDTTVKSLGLVPPGKPYPQLRYLQIGGDKEHLTFSMIFSSPETPYDEWVDPKRMAKYQAFFGPGCVAEVVKVDAEQRLVAIKLDTASAPAVEAAAASE